MMWQGTKGVRLPFLHPSASKALECIDVVSAPSAARQLGANSVPDRRTSHRRSLGADMRGPHGWS